MRETDNALGKVKGVSIFKQVAINPVLNNFLVRREIGSNDRFAVTQPHHQHPAVVNTPVRYDQNIAGLEPGISLLVVDIPLMQMYSHLNGRLHQSLNPFLGIHIPCAASDYQMHIRVLNQVHGLEQDVQTLGGFDLSKKQKGRGPLFDLKRLARLGLGGNRQG